MRSIVVSRNLDPDAPTSLPDGISPARQPQLIPSILSLYHSTFSACGRSLRRLKMERRLPCGQTKSILHRLSWYLPPEVKQVEVRCHLMHADFPCACFYTLESRIFSVVYRPVDKRSTQ